MKELMQHIKDGTLEEQNPHIEELLFRVTCADVEPDMASHDEAVDILNEIYGSDTHSLVSAYQQFMARSAINAIRENTFYRDITGLQDLIDDYVHSKDAGLHQSLKRRLGAYTSKVVRAYTAKITRQ